MVVVGESEREKACGDGGGGLAASMATIAIAGPPGYE